MSTEVETSLIVVCMQEVLLGPSRADIPVRNDKHSHASFCHVDRSGDIPYCSLHAEMLLGSKPRWHTPLAMTNILA